MKIGILIGRIGGVDGVALETEKWIAVLQKMGHEVYTLSGQFEERKLNPNYETLVPEMSFFSPEGFWGQKKAFHFPDNNLEELLEHIHFYADLIKNKIINWAKEKKIDILISENASALPAHIEMGLGIKKAVVELSIPTITHDHDFYWERGDRYISPHDEINNIVSENFPLRLPNVLHAVINTYGQETLAKRFNRESVLVPNVMNFDLPFGEINQTNINLKRNLGLKKEDYILAQVTRIVRRKGIETAIRLIHMLEDKHAKLIITGSHSDDEGNIYYQELIDQIHELKLEGQVIFASHIIKNNRRQIPGSKAYSLSDAYAHAKASTYFSTYEGFGNAFIESVMGRCPVFVNNYKPVYWPDIGSKGFKTVMLENNIITDKALSDMKEIINNEALNQEIGEYNYQLGKKYFSFDTLEKKLQELLEKSSRL
ncbi:glycosyltransferase family 4 protein [Ancylomarina longa]|uniref:Glycosyltransferase n=1 Tax=Ancylomarina longa TaxID=2487017 RepID=A0A434ATP7_9BACT|nr:glycosyltransferase family 4 protein [Ancylomarina longa]RUT77704.1 glycosyltransferase [Ancylomarina longa]